jgi:hypothetical protein
MHANSRMPARLIALLAAAAVSLLAWWPGPARANSSQVAIMQEDLGLMGSNPLGTLAHLRALGVQVIRFPVRWSTIAPTDPKHTYRKPRFNAGDPASRAYNWAELDTVVRDSAQYGIALDFDVVGGAPDWVLGPGARAVNPHAQGHNVWEPSATELGQFFKAVALRYTGHFNPSTGKQAPGNPNDLPRVAIWSIWNEPDYGPSLAPQGLPGHINIEYSPTLYRNMVDQAWNALQHTGHGHDTILFGELAPRGRPSWGVFSGMKPLIFLRAMYCVDARYQPLRGTAARLRGCPSTTAGSKRFRKDHPAMFAASGFSDHPYMRWYSPNREWSPDPYYHTSTADYSSLGDIGQLERSLDRLQRVYGSHRQFPIWDTEFGYITDPPHRHNDYPWVSPSTAAYYLNWAEYIHWRDPRIRSYDQYLLQDPLPALKSNDYGGFASGLVTYGGQKKADYAAYRLPLYLPTTSTRRGRSLEVWGCIRPARAALREGLGGQTADIQVGPGANPSNAAFKTVATTTVRSATNCYFDTHVKFPGAGTETVRLVWHYPMIDPSGYFDPLYAMGAAAYSRHVEIKLK